MHYDVIIIGAGSMGMAAGYYTAKKGKKVLLIDAYDPPHSEGSHHGESRIIRHAYGEGLSYVPMALRAQELWDELQESTNELLFSKTGVLTVGAPESEFILNILKSADTHSLTVQKLTSEEIHDKWSGFLVPDDMIGCFEENSGVLFSEACIRTYKNLAVENGAVLKMNTKVTGISIVDGTVTVEIEQGSIKGNSLIIATGKGTPDILAFLGLTLPLQLVRKTFSWLSQTKVSMVPIDSRHLPLNFQTSYTTGFRV
ncbi:N-methyl-L-tryptophan oxidase [Paenisporosarcina sp. TG20]|uniref:N-methyl-L-tryptophan oxidase n=1 Tax=Paenisporosarcina sp. TG20 TaxID=1211706 RepID=UPI0003084775